MSSPFIWWNAIGGFFNCVSRNYDFSKRTIIGYIQSVKRGPQCFVTFFYTLFHMYFSGTGGGGGGGGGGGFI